MAQPVVSIRSLTESCVSQFKQLVARPGGRFSERLENQMADFNLWAYGVGALAGTGLSLDSRLRDRVSDFELVITIVGMLEDSLSYFASLSEDDPEADDAADDAVLNMDSALQNLAVIGVAVRRAGKASRNRRADRSFRANAYQELRQHLECIVLLRPSQKPLFRSSTGDENWERCVPVVELSAPKLSDLQKRLVDANLRRRHNFLVAQKRAVVLQMQRRGPEIPLLTKQKLADEDASAPESQHIEYRQEETAPVVPASKRASMDIVPRISGPSLSGYTHASTAEGPPIKHESRSRNTPGVARTQITSIASLADFPSPPPVPPGREISQCPLCCQSLPASTFLYPQEWKKHVVEDLCPYTCIAENCPTPELIYSTRREWEDHVKKRHTPRYDCPLCDDDEPDRQPINSRDDMEQHIQSHHADELFHRPLSKLVSESTMEVLGITSCPLCDSSGPQDAPELVDHVLQHTYNFSLRALPWPKPIEYDINIPPGAFSSSIDRDAHLSKIPSWVSNIEHESDGIPELQLCSFDRADHAPGLANRISEYTEYFDTNPYFDDARDNASLYAQEDQSTTSQTSSVSLTMDDLDRFFRVVRFSKDGKRLTLPTENNATIELWDTESSTCITELSHYGTLYAVEFFPDSQDLATACIDGTIKVWDAATGRNVAVLQGHSDPVTCLNLFNRTIVSGDSSGHVRLWDAEKFCPKERFSVNNPIVSLEISTSGEELLVASRGGPINVIKIRPRLIYDDPIITFPWDAKEPVSFASFSPDGTRILSSSNHIIKIWDMATGSNKTCDDTTGSVSGVGGEVRFSYFDGDVLAIVAKTLTVIYYDANTADRIWKEHFDYSGRISERLRAYSSFATSPTFENMVRFVMENALIEAVEQSLRDVAKTLINRGTNINARGRCSGSALQAASSLGDEATIGLLLDKGANINLQSGYYGSPLHAAVAHGHENIVRLLLNEGANVNILGRRNGSPLHEAAKRNNAAIFQLLIDAGADPNIITDSYSTCATPLEIASLHGNLDFAKILVSRGANVNFTGTKLRFPLHAASSRGNVDIVSLLLDHGADINKAFDIDLNQTSLWEASKKGHLDVVKLLLDKGADPNHSGFEYKCRPLHVASSGGFQEIIRLLLEKGANVNAQDDDFVTPLYLACRNHHLDIAELLIDKGADINHESRKCGSALHIASSNGDWDIVKLLIGRGADPHASRSEDNLTPYDAAKANGHDGIADFLLQHMRTKK